jgi:hypothetical protein
MARVVTLDQVCRREGVDLEELLGELQPVTVASPRVFAGIAPITRVTDV